MDDLISRQVVIDAIRGWVNKALNDWGNEETEIRCFNAIYPLIMALPSAQPEDKCGECDAWNQYKNYPRRSQWIPCSERLPEEEGYYWTVHSYMSGHIGYNVSRFAKDLYKVDEYDFAEWKGVSGFYTIDEEYGYIKNEVIAWMPIEPRRGEEHEAD